MAEQIDCTICLGPVSMRPDKAENRVWDTAVEPGGWCHRLCWEDHRTPSAQRRLLNDIFGDPIIEKRRATAEARVRESGHLVVRRPA